MISAVIISRNEEKNIKNCIESIKWCDEIIVIDDHSNDNTAVIAEKNGARVYIRSLDNNFSAQRNFGLQKAKGDWILFVDADEIVSPALWFEIMQHTNSPTDNSSGYFIKRQDTIWDTLLKYGETGNVKLLRLAKKDAGEWIGTVHEVWNIKGNTEIHKNPLMHYPHISVEKFLREINFYTDIRSKELFNKKVKSSWIFIILYPFSKFIRNYVIKLGYRDGIPGLVLAMMMSFHSFLVRSKLWLAWQKQK